MKQRFTNPPAGSLARRGFTLVELTVVVVIIGIILSFVLVAGMDAARRAEERATQTLITKLDGGLNDRLEALLQTRPDYTTTHYNMASVYYDSKDANNVLPSITRAQVIAWYDYVKAQMPDVFVVQGDGPGSTPTSTDYPLNFAGVPLAGGTVPYSAMLPLGASSPGTGIYGAAYTAAAGIYKNLGYYPAGYDGVDNSVSGSGVGLIDEWGEGVDDNNLATVQAHLGNHTHSTARSEMLYALLVEGGGPLGSVFSRDEFTDREVQDTDGDGLPEFVDAWGQPLQFYRWPLFYHSDIQRGQVISSTGGASWSLLPPYVSVFETREQDPLDPNQQLMSPAWWFSANNPSAPSGFTGISSGLGVSNGVLAFETFFHRLSEPYPFPTKSTSTVYGYYWDRSTSTGYGARRAFYSKFLIISSGQDHLSGIFRYPDSSPPSATQLIANENNAMQFGLDLTDFTSSATLTNTAIPVDASNPSSYDATNPTSYDLQQAGQDDISNQNLSAAGAIGGSG